MDDRVSEAGPLDVATRVETLRQVIRHRRSCRKYRPDPISSKDLEELVEAGIWAPSGSNAQNQRFLVIEDKQEIDQIGSYRWMVSYATSLSANEIRERFPHGLIGGASALILVFADAALNNRRNNGEYYIWENLETQNCAASIQNILLLAAAKGIGSCWVSATEQMSYTRLLTGQSWREVLARYDIPPSYKIQGLVMLGWPASTDDHGYPKGEGVHGVIRRPTERESLKEYLVHRAQQDAIRSRGEQSTWQVRLWRKGIELLLRMVAFLDRRIYQLEIGK